MGTISVIVILIAGISLYDYLSSRKWQQVTSEERNEMVFASRNREYGAYQIRKSYNLNVVLIVGIMIFSIGSAYGIYRLVKVSGEVSKPEPDQLALLTMDAPKIDEPLDPPIEPDIPELEQTIQFTEPVVTDDANEADEVPTVEELAVIKAGDEDQEGNGGLGGLPVEEEKKEEVVEKVDNTIYAFTDEPAVFNGDVKKYLAENIKYPQTAIELGLEGKCYLQFVVSANGNISNVDVKRGVPDCKECDEEAVRVVKRMPKWTPAKNAGKPVNSTFNLPVSFKLN